MKIGTESLAFTDKGACRDKVAALRAAGVKHVICRTDQIDGRMHYVVCWPTSEQMRLDEAETKVLLTQAEEVCSMENEGGNPNVVGQ
jgi:hypothetical protein